MPLPKGGPAIEESVIGGSLSNTLLTPTRSVSCFVNTRLICHLPLIVPGKCVFRVGNELREWVEGKAWVFDDTMEHEAWNGSERTRVILLFEIWRPELTMEERALVSAMFEAIDAYKI